MLKKLHVVAIAAALVSIGFAAQPLVADDYPSRPITDIVASTPGGGTDIVSRIFGEQLSKQLGQPFVVENLPGAGSLTGTVTAARAAPDGYTLQTGLTASMAVNPSLFAHLPYDPVTDFEPAGMLAQFPFVLVVSNNFPAHSVKELIDMAKAKPGQINYASAGNGTGQHLSMELFKLMAGINLAHVPYRGAAPAYADVMTGQVPVFFDNLAAARSARSKAARCARSRSAAPSARRFCPMCRRSLRQACRAIPIMCGSGCGRRKARRSRSSTGCTPRSKKRRPIRA